MDDDIKQLIEKRDALNDLITEKTKAAKVRAIETCKKLIEDFGLTSRDLGLIHPPRKMKRLKPKYVGPDGQFWAGRGRVPVWMKKAIEEGKSPEDFRV